MKAVSFLLMALTLSLWNDQPLRCANAMGNEVFQLSINNHCHSLRLKSRFNSFDYLFSFAVIERYTVVPGADAVSMKGKAVHEHFARMVIFLRPS